MMSLNIIQSIDCVIRVVIYDQPLKTIVHSVIIHVDRVGVGGICAGVKLIYIERPVHVVIHHRHYLKDI